MEKIFFIFIFTCISFCTTQAAQLAAGEVYSLALKENGNVWAWGDNYPYGQLGDGTTIDRLTPVQVSNLTDVISIAAGAYHSLALKRDGTVWAWGYNGWGQLGNGTADGIGGPAHPNPELIIGVSGVIDVAGGWVHSLFLKSDGTVWACGLNENGSLGDGSTTDRYTPVQVLGLSGVISIAAAGEHSLALKSDGTVWAWGWNKAGQLGDGNGGPPPDDSGTNYSTVPVQAIGLSNVTAVAGGSSHSLALKNDGTVWSWGGNLGDGRETNSLTPVQSLISGVVAIGGGEDYTLALTSYGKVWFWGRMELSGYNTDYIDSIIPVPVDTISGVTAIGAGHNHALALKSDGTLWSWGDNHSGRLGDGTTINQRSPVQVQGFSTNSSDPVINPDVKVNSANGPLTVSAGTPITVTVQISPAYLGLDSDWWIAAYGFGSWFYLVMEDFYPKWIAVSDSTPIQPIYQGPLTPIGPVPIIESEYWLPRGDYEFFFAVDTLMDGLLTLDALHYDSAILTIQ